MYWYYSSTFLDFTSMCSTLGSLLFSILSVLKSLTIHRRFCLMLRFNESFQSEAQSLTLFGIHYPSPHVWFSTRILHPNQHCIHRYRKLRLFGGPWCNLCWFNCPIIPVIWMIFLSRCHLVILLLPWWSRFTLFS